MEQPLSPPTTPQSFASTPAGGARQPIEHPPVKEAASPVALMDSLMGGPTETAPAEPVAEATAPVDTPVQAEAPAQTDDLTKIEGIGPKIAEHLSAHGISTYAQLAQSSPEQLREILDAGGYKIHEPATWPKQSAMADAGDWDNLKVWQDELDGGKPVAPADDLTKIEGIGPKIAEHLAANGISSYALLAAATPDQLREILAAGGYSAHDPGTWPQQSGMAAAGDWDNLKVWQDELDGGKVVSAPDDLTRVEGIGPKVAELINSNGVTTFAQLAATSPETISEWLTAAGGMMANMKPGTWPKQAEMAANGQWDELQVWQDELDGGV
ncbi:MAG: helix-hairpin-helix domain-containing protein [Pirellulaceae bacterium]